MGTEAPLVLGGEFPSPSVEEWRAGVDKVLAKGKSDLSVDELAKRYERDLVTHLYDNIAVAPLYRAGDVGPAGTEGMPGSAPFVRAATVLANTQGGWDIRQAVDLRAADPASAGPVVLEQLERGASSLFLRSPDSSLPEGAIDAGVLDQILEGAYLDLITVSLDATLGAGAGDALLDLFVDRNIEGDVARAVLGMDPIGAAASHGTDAGLDDRLAEMATVAQRCLAQFPNSRAVVVDVTRYHDAGASDSEELACAMATGVAYLRTLTAAGCTLDQALDQIEFRFAATADQFLTIAKLRAARMMWSRVAQACGQATGAGMRQHAVTSRAMLTRYDPWVNLLRGTIACFAAGVGGADAVTVEPYDQLLEAGGAGELGRRMARNTQIILMEESHAAKIIDPAGGSWYVEWLTDSLAHESWSFFQTIEAASGMAAALESRIVSDRIAATWQRRLANLSVRTDTITGVSDFPNADEQIAPVMDRPAAPRHALPRRRYAEPFEELRSRADVATARRGERPSVLLVNLGSPSAYTARTTYAKSFFETGGLRTVALDVDDQFSARLAEVIASGCDVACLCSSDAQYAESGPAVVAQLRAAGVRYLYVAGRQTPELAALAAAGVDTFFGVGSDVLGVLATTLELLGVE